MAFHHLNIYHALGMYLSLVSSLSLAQDLKLPLKAVNLGNWLVVEGWMEPSLFAGIPNNKLLGGTKVQFKSTKLQKYLAAENGGDSNVADNRISASDWETFKLWRINENSFHFRVSRKQFVGLSRQGNGRIVAKRYAPGNTETFQIARINGDHRVRIKVSNSLFLQAKSEAELTADYPPGGSGWEDSDPSVFIMKIVETLQGEYQLTNGYGPERASKVMQAYNFKKEIDRKPKLKQKTRMHEILTYEEVMNQFCISESEVDMYVSCMRCHLNSEEGPLQLRVSNFQSP